MDMGVVEHMSDTKPTKPENATNVENVVLRRLSAELDVDRFKKLHIKSVMEEMPVVEMLRRWIDGGMPLTAVGVEKQPTAGEVEDSAGKWLATVKLLEEEVTDLKDRLKLAQGVKKQATPVGLSERENGLLTEVSRWSGDYCRVNALLEVANRNLDKVMATSDQQLVKIQKLEAKIVELTKGVVQPTAVAAGKVSDFDQSPEAEELRKAPVVDPGLLPNGLPPGKTKDADGNVVEAGEAPF